MSGKEPLVGTRRESCRGSLLGSYRVVTRSNFTFNLTFTRPWLYLFGPVGKKYIVSRNELRLINLWQIRAPLKVNKQQKYLESCYNSRMARYGWHQVSFFLAAVFFDFLSFSSFLIRKVGQQNSSNAKCAHAMTNCANLIALKLQ